MTRNALLLHVQDNCVVALADIRKGDRVDYECGSVEAAADVALGHKLAIAAIPVGGKVLKYGAVIGSATSAIVPGDHIHTHNLASDYITGYHH